MMNQEQANAQGNPLGLSSWGDRKSSVAKTVHGGAAIFQRAAMDLDEESHPPAKYAERSGTAIEAFSEQLRNSRWSEPVGQMGRLSEERPPGFLSRLCRPGCNSLRPIGGFGSPKRRDDRWTGHS
jgi:hypothetical protein